MSFNQSVNSGLVAVADTDRQELLSNLIQKKERKKERKERKEPDLDLRIYNEEVFEKIISFEKKTSAEVPSIKYIFYNRTTKKQEEIEFYNHMVQYGFT